MVINAMPARQLGDDVRQWWSAAQNASQRLASPYFCPEFTTAVSDVRDDVYVAVIEDNSRIAAVFPFQRTWWGAGRPVGGPVSDFQGIIAGHDFTLDPRWLARCCRVQFWDLPHAVAWQNIFLPYHGLTVDSSYMDLSGGFEVYCDERRRAGSDQVRDAQRKHKRLAREFGPVRFEYDCDDKRVMETLLSWKSRQYRATNKPDVLKEGWIRQLLYRIRDTKSDHFGGVVSALYAGNHLIAAHFGMRSRRVIHWWYPAYDPEFGKYSPGLILCLEVAREASLHAISRIDLGYGDEPWKLGFMSDATQVAEVAVDATDWARSLRNRWRSTRQFIKATPLAVPARCAMRPIRKWLSLE